MRAAAQVKIWVANWRNLCSLSGNYWGGNDVIRPIGIIVAVAWGILLLITRSEKGVSDEQNVSRTRFGSVLAGTSIAAWLLWASLETWDHPTSLELWKADGLALMCLLGFAISTCSAVVFFGGTTKLKNGLILAAASMGIVQLLSFLIAIPF